jgi:hypothetical protein
MALLSKWVFKVLLKMNFGRPSLGGSILVQKLCPRFLGNRKTLTFGLALWKQRNSSSHMVLSLLGMDHKLYFGRISGLVMQRSVNNIRHYIILCDIRAILLLRCWKPSHRMCRSEEVSLVLDKHNGMLCCSDWSRSICRRDPMYFSGVVPRMLNSWLLRCIML